MLRSFTSLSWGRLFLLAFLGFFLFATPADRAQAGPAGEYSCGPDLVAPCPGAVDEDACSKKREAEDRREQRKVKSISDWFNNNKPFNIEKGVCFDMFDKVGDLIAGITAAANYEWGALVEAVLQAVKEWIIDKLCAAIAQALNNAVNSICLPLPDLKLPGLGLPSLGSQSCNGLSLGDIIQFKPVPFTETPPGLARDIARGVMSRGGYTVPYQDKLPH